MSGWIVPPPGLPVKREALRRECEEKVAELGRRACSARSGCAGRCAPCVARTSSRGCIATAPTRRSRSRFPASERRSHARTAIRCSTSRLASTTATDFSRWAGPVMERRWRGRSWVRETSSWPSRSTRQRWRSRARTSNERVTRTSSSSMATGDWGTPRSRLTSGSASRPHAPRAAAAHRAARGARPPHRAWNMRASHSRSSSGPPSASGARSAPTCCTWRSAGRYGTSSDPRR